MVLGGIHPSVCQNEALERCDTIVVGEAKYTWPQIVRDFQDETLKYIYKGERLIHLSKLKRMQKCFCRN